MWNDPSPSWRTARKEHQCQGQGCRRKIAPGDRYLDQPIREPLHSHRRYCVKCGEAHDYFFAERRSAFSDRYQARITSAGWKNMKRQLIKERGASCERCKKETTVLELHHLHYRSVGDEQLSDVELLCSSCHQVADEAREAKHRPKYKNEEEGWIVGPDGERWDKFDLKTIYVPLGNGRYAPLEIKRKS